MALHFLAWGIAIFPKKGMNLAPVKWRQSLNDMVATYHRFVIRSSKFIDGSYPEFIGVTESSFALRRAPLQFTQGGSRENGFEHWLEFDDAVSEKLKEATTINAAGLFREFCAASNGQNRGTIGRARLNWGCMVEHPKQRTHTVADGMHQIRRGMIDTILVSEKNLRQPKTIIDCSDG